MKKRIRKKLRVKEFYVKHCWLEGQFKNKLVGSEVDNFLDSLCTYVDSNNLTFCGSTDCQDFSYIIVPLNYKNDIERLINCAEYISNLNCISSIKFIIITNEKEEHKRENEIESTFQK